MMERTIRMIARTCGLAFIAAAGLSLSASDTFAQVAQQGFPESEKLMKELLAVLVVATVLESALAIVFQWRVYREFFNNRAVKTLVMIAVGGAVVWAFNYDVFTRIMALVGAKGTPGADGIRVDGGFWSGTLSALILAGGSAGVNSVLRALGFRRPEPLPDEQKPDLKADEAWMSVTVDWEAARGRPVDVLIDAIDETVPPAEALAGVLRNRAIGERLRSLFLASTMRVPSYGGRLVKVGQTYQITARVLIGKDDEGRAVYASDSKTCKFATRAVVDVYLVPKPLKLD